MIETILLSLSVLAILVISVTAAGHLIECTGIGESRSPDTWHIGAHPAPAIANTNFPKQSKMVAGVIAIYLIL